VSRLFQAFFRLSDPAIQPGQDVFRLLSGCCPGVSSLDPARDFCRRMIPENCRTVMRQLSGNSPVVSIDVISFLLLSTDDRPTVFTVQTMSWNYYYYFLYGTNNDDD
jgi:hypothetical protein